MSNYDLFHITDKSIKQQIFSNPWNWAVWNKPRQCVMVHFVVIWAGAGGWGGYGGGAGTNRSWGGGGGSGAIVRASVPAYMLPDTLYIYVGRWWAGGAALASGSAGELSYISLLPNNTTATNLVLVSGAAAPTGWGQGNSWSNSTAWVASTIMTATNAILSNRTNFIAIAWVAWQVSAIWATPWTDSAALSTIFLTGWPSGGKIDNTNTAFAGWGITGVTNLVPTIPWGAIWATGWTGGWGYTKMGSMIFTSWAAWGWGTTTWGAGGVSAVWCGGAWGWAGGTTWGAGAAGWNWLVIVTCI